MENTNDLSSSIIALQKLDTLYADDLYMHTKLHTYIANNLPNVMKNIKETNENRICRNTELNNEFTRFINKYLNNNKYYYVSATERFYNYNGNNYNNCSEDSILHNILTTITNERNLLNWKYKTKVSLMKIIKDNSIYNSLPESCTIQDVIARLYPAIFRSKDAAKYFLTVVGDNILKKNTNLIHLVPLYSKTFIRELNNICQTNLGTNAVNSFKLKYHEDHDYNNCRIVNIHETIKYENIWKRILGDVGMNLLCVAIHYSTRFGDSENFLHNNSIDEFSNNVLYLKDKTKEHIVTSFISDYLTTDTKSNQDDKCSSPSGKPLVIKWKDMQYLWNHYLINYNLPSIMYQTTFKDTLISTIEPNYIKDTDEFINVFSRYLPSVQMFVDFWNDTMQEDTNESYLELEEIRNLFKVWNANTNKHTFGLNDQQTLDIIYHFFPDVCIENEKYVHEYNCSLWNKGEQIDSVLKTFKKTYITNNMEGDKTISDIYLFYCKHLNEEKTNGSSNGFIVHKSYFVNHIHNTLKSYIAPDDTAIISSWFNEC